MKSKTLEKVIEILQAIFTTSSVANILLIIACISRQSPFWLLHLVLLFMSVAFDVIVTQWESILMLEGKIYDYDDDIQD